MELLTLTMPNPGAKERNEERMKKLVSQALGYIKCSDTYIQCQLYASRDAHTSLGWPTVNEILDKSRQFYTKLIKIPK